MWHLGPTLCGSLDVINRVVADVWEKDAWEFQAKSGSSGSCRLFLHCLGKIAVQEMSGKTPGSPVPDILLPDIRGLLNQRLKIHPVCMSFACFNSP